MDPLSQAVLGSIAAQSYSKKSTLAKAAVIGGLAGVAPDLDVLISSPHDSLLALEYHRHFTHSLLFIPLGGLICALIFTLTLGSWWQLSFKQIAVWSLLGYATHGLLDACTSYGTQLLWPFSNYRVSWNIISIIDPLYTLPLLALVIIAAVKKQHRFARAAVLWVVMYLILGVVQHERALSLAEDLIAERGHTALAIEAKPSFLNFIVWQIIY